MPPHIAVGFQPVEDNVLVRVVMSDHPASDDTGAWGDVVAIGPGRRTADGALIAPDLTPGDRIAMRPRSAMSLSVHGQSFAIVGGAAVLGVLLPGAVTEIPSKPARAVVDVTAPEAPGQVTVAAEESLETDVAPDLLDREAPTAEDLH